MRKMVFTMQVFFKNGETDKIAITGDTWSGATDKAHELLVGRGEYTIQHGECGYLLESEIKAKIPQSAMAFHKWLLKKGWREHSSQDYWYRSEDDHRWPPEETATEEELLESFFGN